MPVILYENPTSERGVIYILNETSLAEFQSIHNSGRIQHIRDCQSSHLAGLDVYSEFNIMDTRWPLDTQVFPEQLINKMAPVIISEQKETIELDGKNTEKANNGLRGSSILINVCKDRQFIAMLCNKNNQEHLLHYVHNPNKVFNWNIPAIPVCHVSMPAFDLAVSELLREDDKLTWLDSANDIYNRLVMPHLNMVKILHDQQINHGDISDENVILSEKFQ